ncbi:MAG TPA: hypothetical protein DCZ95_14245 [Verrucomicrobia bacterium]|nr:hypothetical protein [Verrucomicrobiota bacterium]
MALLGLQDVSMAFGGPLLLDDVNLQIEEGERVCLLGRNGEGKSTLLRIVGGELEPKAGVLSRKKDLRVGYMPQQVPQGVSGTVAEVVAQGAGALSKDWERSRLIEKAISQMGLDPDASFESLSGGQKRRTMLARALAQEPELLVLDEPTNHLDLTSKDVLLEALKAFEGTVLFVSHDRGFIAELADMVLELEAGATPRLYYGDYSYYLEKKAALAAAAATQPTSLGSGFAPRAPNAVLSASEPHSPAQTGTWEDEKARKARHRKLKRREEEILARLLAVSTEKKTLEGAMALPANYSDGVKVKKILASIAGLETEASSLNEEWMDVADELSSFE